VDNFRFFFGIYAII